MMYCAFCTTSTNPKIVVALDADEGRHQFRISFCGRCGSGSLLDSPTDHELAHYYEACYYGRGKRKFQSVFQYVFDAGKRRLARSVLVALHDAPNPRVLDMGCGTGQLLVELERLGAVPIGFERPGGAARAVRPGLRIIEGEIGEHVHKLDPVDAVVIWHVLEHLRDPVAVLRASTSLLPSGGLLFLAVPNAASWQARIFGRYWFHLDIPRHLHFLTADGLRKCLSAEDFIVVREATLQWSQSLFGFVQSTLNLLCPRVPNRLYRLMRDPLTPSRLAELSIWAVAVALLTPFALLEAVFAEFAGAGAVCMVVAKKA